MGHKYTKVAGDDAAGEACLYLGSIDWVIEDEILERFGIQAIVSVLPQKPQYAMEVLHQHGIADSDYLVYPLEDSAQEYISLFQAPTIVDTCKFIHDKRLQGKTILVHCDAGITRSAAVVVGYIMTYGQHLHQPKSMPLDDAAALVRSLRERMDICTFQEELLRLQRIIQGVESLRPCLPPTQMLGLGPGSPLTPKSWSEVRQEGDPIVELSLLQTTWNGIRSMEGGESAFGQAVLHSIFALGGNRISAFFAEVDMQRLSGVMACMLRRIVWSLDANNMEKLVQFHRHLDIQTADLQVFHGAFMITLRERLNPPEEALQSWERFLRVVFNRWAKAIGQPVLNEHSGSSRVCPFFMHNKPLTPKLALPPRRTK